MEGNQVSAIERRQQLLTMIESANSITVSELSRRLGVSAVTVRKDLEALEDHGLVTRTYGGAILGQTSVGKPGVANGALPLSACSPVVAKAAGFIRPGQTIMLGEGEFLTELADYLIGLENLTVLTVSVKIALKLMKSPAIDVILTGGILRARTMTMLGHLAERVIRELDYDVSFSEVDGIDPVRGITSNNMVEANTAAAVLSNCKQAVIIAEASALGKVAPVQLSKITPGFIAIINGRPDTAAVRQLSQAGLKIIIA